MTPQEINILLVEDNPGDSRLILEMLKDGQFAGGNIFIAQTLADALSRVRMRRFDVILLDLNLPDSDGAETLDRVIAAAGNATPVIVLTGFSEESIGLSAIERGAADFLAKEAITPKQLARSMRYALERRRAEESLRENQERYRRISEMISDYAYAFQVAPDQTLKRDWIIGGFKRITGFTPEESEARGGWEALIHPDDKPAALARIGRLLAGEPDASEVRIVCKEGRVRWLMDHGRPEWDPTQQRVVAIYGAVQDITGRKLAEIERERLMAAIEQAGEVIFITDPEGVIQYVNPMFETVTGYTRKEAVGQTPRILKSGEQDEAFYRNLWETISGGRIWKGRMTNLRKDGTRYTEEATISPICDAGGRITSYVAVKHDITEHLRLAAQYQQAQKMESVGRLAGGVAHDYNNMLGVIIGNAELALMKSDPGDPIYDHLMEILSAAGRSAEITRQLLAFARKQVIAPRVMDLNDTVESMLKMLRRLIGEDIDLVWMPEPGLWQVNMDPGQIDQILANLCVNARDAIAGVGRITIETDNMALDAAYCSDHAGSVPGEYALLIVSDNGCGMSPETQEQIFEPFFTTKELGKGTGLGLAMVYGIVKQNRGFINVYSEPGKGTTFRIYLPRHAGQPEDGAADVQAKIPLSCGETVLIVEDEATILSLAENILEVLGYTVLTALTPEAAIRLAEGRTGRIDLLLTDVVMPGMNGRELSDRMNALYPGIKTLFMSGYTSDALAVHSVLEADVHFIQKPFSVRDMAVKVRAALD